jgi:hypothetical protein
MKNRALVFFLALLLAPFSDLAEAAAATHFLVTAPGTATANTSFSFTVQALDATNAVDTTYAGTVNFTSNDPAAVLPAPSTLVNGVRTFSATLYTGGSSLVIGANDGGGSGGVSGVSGSIVVAAPAHFSVNAPANVTANTPFNFTVQALDQFFNPINYYPGPIHFTSNDPLAILPPNTTMPTGFGTFSATLYTGGQQGIGADDNAGSGGINGMTNIITVAAPAHFSVNAPAIVTANTPFNFTVQALDQFSNPINYYPGPIHFTSSDPLAILPPNTTMPTGFGTFSATLYTGGQQGIGADDNSGGSGGINGMTNIITVAAPAHFSVNAPANVTANTPFNFTVQALDQFSNPINYYPGPIHFTSSDPLAILPPNTTMPTGFGTFSATLYTIGQQGIGADDNNGGSGGINGMTNIITVNAAVATHFIVTAPASVTAGVAASFTVTALDATNAVVPTYAGTVHFTASDGQAVLPANATLVAGVGTFSATLKTAGNQTITATDTVTASMTGTSGAIAVAPGAATHFGVSAPASAIGNLAFSFTVTALDAFNNTATGYSGIAHFTSTDGAATLPADSILTSGVGTFSATLRTAGSRTLTATDTVSAPITGTSGAINVTAAVATHFTVSAPVGATAGAAFSFTVSALDSGNAVATGYSGIVHFTASDGQAVLPANATLTNGVGTFSATLKTAGSQTITAADTVSAAITGTSNAILVAAGAATHLSVSAPGSATSNSAFTFSVTALDAFNNTASGYSGTAHFTSTDGAATLPADATLSLGLGIFSATLRTSGARTITATDTVNASITGTSGAITVGAGGATHFTVSAPASATAGTAFSVTVTALDATNNTATGYAGTVHFTSSDAQAVLPANATLVNGVGTFSATLKTAGNRTITATDTVSASITGTSAAIAVAPGPASRFVVTAPASATNAVAVTFTVAAQDAFGNATPGYAGTVHFTSSDGAATLAADATLASGTGSFSATLRSAGTQTITATDTGTASITGTSNPIAVSAAPLTTFSGASPTGTGTITASFTGGGATCGFVAPEFIPVTGHAKSPPAGSAPAAFPHGLFDFATSGCTPGSTLAFTITYPQPLPPGTQYWKYGPRPGAPAAEWYALPATITGAVASFTITDGGLGDDDLLANGAVIDQGGPGVPGAGTGGAIPTLSEWAMLLLAFLIIAAASRRKRHA